MGSRLHKIDFLKIALPIGALLLCEVGWSDGGYTVFNGGQPQQAASQDQAQQQLQNQQNTDMNTAKSDASSTNVRSAQCKTSETADNGRYNCGNTQQAITMWGQASQLGQALTNTATNAMGQLQQQNVVSSASVNGVISPAATMNAAAKTMEAGAMAQMANAAVTGTAAYMQWQAAQTHTRNADEFKAAAQSQLDVNKAGATGDGTQAGQFGYLTAGGNANYAATAIMNSELNVNDNKRVSKVTASGTDPQSEALRLQQATARQASGQKVLASTATTAANEQAAMATLAKNAAIKSGIQSAMQMLQAGSNFMAASQEKNLANNLANNANPLTLTSGNVNPGSADSGISTGLNAGTNPDGTPLNAVQAGGGVTGASGCGILGCANPSAEAANQLAGVAPTAGAFSPSSGGAGGGGGGGGGSVGDMSTTAAKDDSQPDQPKGLDGKGGPAYVAGNPNMSNGGVSADKGPDLSGLLAQFLPKKEEDHSKNGILDFASRNPASNDGDSLLGRNENLFKRISERMQTDYRKGAVGIPEHKI